MNVESRNDTGYYTVHGGIDCVFYQLCDISVALEGKKKATDDEEERSEPCPYHSAGCYSNRDGPLMEKWSRNIQPSFQRYQKYVDVI